MSDMKCPIKCPICGEMLQKYGEVDPDAGASIVLGANCPKCNIGNSDIKLWQELIRTRKALDLALAELQEIDGVCDDNKYTDNLYVGLDGQDTRNIALDVKKTITQITALTKRG